MDNISDQALPETSFEFSHYNQDTIIISFGPKNGFLWRGEAFDEKKHLIEGLNKVFTEGFTQGDEQSILANLDYIKQNYPDFLDRNCIPFLGLYWRRIPRNRRGPGGRK